MEKLLILGLTALLVSGCATTYEKEMEATYKIKYEEKEINGRDYYVGKNTETKKIFIQYNPGIANRLFNPKYGNIGVLLDATRAIDYEKTLREAADKYLELEDPTCKTGSLPGRKIKMESYVFNYKCTGYAHE